MILIRAPVNNLRPEEASQVSFKRDCPRVQFTYGRYVMVWADHKIVSVPASVTKPLEPSSDEYTSKTKAVPQFLRVECGTYRKGRRLGLRECAYPTAEIFFVRMMAEIWYKSRPQLLGSLLVLTHSPNSKRRRFRFENSNVSIVRLWWVDAV